MTDRLSYLKGRSTWDQLGDSFLQNFIGTAGNLDQDSFKQLVFLCERFGPLDEDFSMLASESAQNHEFAWRLAKYLHERGKRLMSKNLVQQEQDFAVAGTLCYYYAAQMDPRYFPAHIAIGSCLARGGNTATALEYINQGLLFYRKFKKEPHLNNEIQAAVEAFKEETVLALQSELKVKQEEEEKR